MNAIGWRRGAGSLLILAAFFASLSIACAREIKIGIMGPFSGPFAEYGQRYRQAVELFLAQHESRVGSDTVSILYRDVGGNAPQRARQLAQELVVRDRVDYIGGLALTPNVFAVADVITEAKIPFVIFNSGTSGVPQKSPYFVRTGFTQWTVSFPIGRWAAEHGKKTAAIAVADYAPGYDAANAFAAGFKEHGGQIVETIKVPLNTTDYSSYLQRIQSLKPDCVFVFLNAGPMAVTFLNGYIERGLRASGIELYGTSEFQEIDLPKIGAGAVGIVSALHYSPNLDNPENKTFVSAMTTKFGEEALPDIFTVQAYDGMQVLFHMIEATGGQSNPEKAIESVRGFAWNSPRGPVSIDPQTRDIVQNVYVRRVVNEGGKLVDRAFETFKAVKDQTPF
jgi:branched-chain amino acid transport system substrate-binding protein